MAEVFGLVFGASGLFPYLQACLQGYKFISTLRLFGRDAAHLEARFVVEETRLLLWGRIHNLVTEQGQLNDREVSDYLLLPEVKKMVNNLLVTIAGVSEGLREIMAKYELKARGDAPRSIESIPVEESPAARLNGPLHSPMDDPEVERGVEVRSARGNELNTSGVPMKKRLTWSLRDRKAFEGLLEDFKEGVSTLYSFTLPLHQLSLSQGLGSRLPRPAPSLPIQSRIAALEPYSDVAMDYPELKAQLDAQVQAWQIMEAEEGETSLEMRNPPLLPEIKDGVRKGRCLGTLEGSHRQVLIEWKTYNPNNIRRVDVKHRINTLVRLLNTAPPLKYPVLRCTGFFEDPGRMNETIRAWIGVVYELPPFPPGRSAAPITLHELLALGNEFPMPDLGDRFRLAQKLSEFMLHIHSCGWLHKGLRPDNVLFFSTSPVSIREPYIVGWEYSRKVANVEQTETILSDNHDADLYCHPDQLKKQSYRPQFDHYKLGCLLLEIGQWNLLQDIPKGTEIQPGDMKAKLMRRAGRLGKSMGKIYQDVVKLLLQGLDDGNFWADVVLQLKKCNA